jgi:hypothetical protein
MIQGAYSYYAFAPVFATSLCHAENSGVAVVEWQSGDYPTTHANNALESVLDAERAMEILYPAQVRGGIKAVCRCR